MAGKSDLVLDLVSEALARLVMLLLGSAFAGLFALLLLGERERTADSG